MIILSKEQTLTLHAYLTSETGGDPNLRDTDLLDSALCSPFQTFGGSELYPTDAEKIARAGYALISDHAFVDGNKRIGMLVLLTLLELNGIKADIPCSEVSRAGLAVASGAMSCGELLEWMTEYIPQ